MLGKFTTPLTKLVDKYLPDPFVIVLLLTFFGDDARYIVYSSNACHGA